MSDESSGCAAVVFVLLIIIGGSIGLHLWGYEEAESKYQQQAVERGHAEWVVDDYGNATWRWKE